MAVMQSDDFGQFALDLEEVLSLPDAVLDEMITAEGEVIRQGQKSTAQSMLQGPYNQGAVAGSVALSKPTRTADGRIVYVRFQGSQHGNRLAEIAFVNEYGKHGQAPRQFIRVANESNTDKAVDAAENVYNDYLSSRGF